MQKKSARRNSRRFIETLEHRTLLSADAGPALHADVLSPATTTTLIVSSHNARLGQPVKVTVSVRALKRFGSPAGSVEFLDGGNLIQASGGPLEISLNSAGRATYMFDAGNIALYVGRHRLSAEFISSNALPDSTSRISLVNVFVPLLKTFSDGLETATIHPGHGAAIGAGQSATVAYTGFLQSDGVIFDYSAAHSGTFSFTVDASPEQTIPGFDQGVVGMKTGQTRILALPSSIAYGAKGAPPTVPANASLVFLVTLISISEPP